MIYRANILHCEISFLIKSLLNFPPPFFLQQLFVAILEQGRPPVFSIKKKKKSNCN